MNTTWMYGWLIPNSFWNCALNPWWKRPAKSTKTRQIALLKDTRRAACQGLKPAKHLKFSQSSERMEHSRTVGILYIVHLVSCTHTYIYITYIWSIVFNSINISIIYAMSTSIDCKIMSHSSESMLPKGVPARRVDAMPCILPCRVAR